MRISVSDLECYRRYRDNEEVALEQCLAQLRRESPPSPAMLAGRALHSALETAAYGDESIELKHSTSRFFFDCDVDLAVPAVRELKGEIEIPTPCGPVTLVGIVDAIDSSVHDYKLTGRMDAERFADSYQWRCYLMMFDKERFLYRVFVGQEDVTGAGFDGVQFCEWRIREYHELSFYRYPNMEEDVIREVSECAEFMGRYLMKKAA